MGKFSTNIRRFKPSAPVLRQAHTPQRKVRRERGKRLQIRLVRFDSGSRLHL